MASKITSVNFTEVPIVYPPENGSGKTPDINTSPFQLLRYEKKNEKNDHQRGKIIHTLHQAPQTENTAPIIAVVNRFSHVAPSDDNLHFMIAPNSTEFHTLQSISPELLNNMSKIALNFLEEAPVGAIVLTHETDHEMVDSPKPTHKSWKQIHWHLRHENESNSIKALTQDESLTSYGDRLIELFKKDKPLLIGKELKTYGFDLAFHIPFPENPEDLSQILKSLDAWARRTQPILASEQMEKIPDGKFMHKPIHTIAFRKTKNNELEIAIMPHLKSPDFSTSVDGESFNGITLEPFGHALKRVSVAENPKDILRIRNSVETISKLRECC
jgi:hypothetical protein